MIRAMHRADIPAVARLHSKFIESSIFSVFGEGFLRHLYESLVSSPYGINYVYEEDSQIVGFISGTTDSSGFFKEAILKKGLSLFITSIFNTLCALEIAVLRFLPATFFYFRKAGFDSIKAELLFIALEPAYRRRGIGQMLLREALAELKERGIFKVKVTLVKENRPAASLLGEMGFCLERTFWFYGRLRNLYSLGLTQ